MTMRYVYFTIRIQASKRISIFLRPAASIADLHHTGDFALASPAVEKVFIHAGVCFCDR